MSLRAGHAEPGSPSARRLLVFSDDWGRHPSSCQHLIRELLPRFCVLWVNTIGTRPPRIDSLTLRRGLGKLRAWLGSRRTRGLEPAEEDNPQILEPLMWPSFRGQAARKLNRGLLTKAVAATLSESPSGSRVAVTTIPLVADLVGRLGLERWVYYCVDDLSEWPGLDRKTLLEMERELVERVDEIVAVSERLVDRMASLGRDARLLTHGVDLEHWRRDGDPHPLLDDLPRPRVVFWGVVDRRLDTLWLKRLGERLGSGSVVLVGPANDPDPGLEGVPGLRQTGPLPYESLPQIARAASALIMPYGDMPATRAMQPLKLKEYLATGRPVVVSSLPAVAEWRDACDVVSGADEFADRVLLRLAGGVPEAQLAARRRLEGESWTAKAAIFERFLLGGTA